MIIEMTEDNSIIRWKYKDKWKCAEISDLILAYEKQERPQGEWIIAEKITCAKCPFCEHLTEQAINYCPWCGAKMT